MLPESRNSLELQQFVIPTRKMEPKLEIGRLSHISTVKANRMGRVTTMLEQQHQTAPEWAAEPLEEAAPFVLGGWLVQPQRNRLQWLQPDQQGDETETDIRLEPRLMHLLCLLAGQAGEVLDRDCLMQKLWPKVIVNENSLTRAVSDLRRELKRHDPGFNVIETIPKRGYRLTTAIEDVPENLNAIPCAGRNRPGWLNAQYRRYATGALAALLLLVTGQLLWSDNNPLSRTASDESGPAAIVQRLQDEYNGAEQSDPTRYELTSKLRSLPVTPERNFTGEAVSSPDGSLFAYIQQDERESRLILASTRSLQEPVILLEAEGRLDQLQWSPVGNGLLFVHQPLPRMATLQSSSTRAAGRLLFFDLDQFRLRTLLDDGNGSPVEDGGDGTYNLT